MLLTVSAIIQVKGALALLVNTSSNNRSKLVVEKNLNTAQKLQGLYQDKAFHKS